MHDCFCVWVGLCIYTPCEKIVKMCARGWRRKRWLLVDVCVYECGELDSLNDMYLCFEEIVGWDFSECFCLSLMGNDRFECTRG